MHQSLQITALRLHSLEYRVDVVDRLVMLFWRGGRYTIYVFYCGSVSPFPYGCYLFHFLAVGLVKEDIGFCLCLLVGGLVLPLPDVFVEYIHLCQKGDPF